MLVLSRVLIACLLAFSLSAHAQSDTEQWIKKMRTAAIYESYRGVFMFTRGEMSSSMRVVHRFYKGQEQERLTQLDGEMGEILRRGNEVMCLVKGKQLIQLDKKEFNNPVSSAFNDFMPGHMHYDLLRQGFDRVVKRPTVKLAIKAKDDARYSYQLWLDEDTGLLLKSQVLNLKGKPLESFQFTDIELPAKTRDEEFAFDLDGEIVSHHMLPMSQADARWPEQLQWETSYLPDGFMALESSETNGNVIIFSDGLANFTVFVELKKQKKLPMGASMIGASVVYLHELSYSDKVYTVTVVGEVPPMTAMKVAEGVRPVMQSSTH